MRRVVVTGLGAVTPLACGVAPSWIKLKSGTSGVKKIKHFNTEDLSSKIAGLAPSEDNLYSDGYDNIFKATDWVKPKDIKKMDRFVVYAVAAATQAVDDAELACIKDENEKERTGVLIAAGIGGLSNIYETAITIYEKDARRVSPFFIPACLINMPSGHVSIKYGFKGPNLSIVTACTSGSHAIGEGTKIIQRNAADIMVVGGTEAAVCRLGVAGFCALKALSTRFNEMPSQASRPWDEDRDGFVMGEGAGVLVLEELEHAKKRGAKIYAEVIGYGASSDAYHITAPEENGDGAYRSMLLAIKDAEINIDDLDYINAHGTSTPAGDIAELKAVSRILECSLKPACMSSTKSSVGHLLGAAGAVEAIFSIMAIREGIAPPTLNLHREPDGFKIDLVPLVAKEVNIDIALSNSFGFGGTNSSLVFKKFS
ncbi:MAG: beta-ketoacyl-ACP synthase II [Holosporales bacterium]|jgi:3-oxoacyl-[acyl-carrier-protein] synthase II|nr:beta-ketoacyl-ACP synthase II [Holosporales bacterium]